MTLKNKYDVNLLSFDLLNKDDKQIYSLEREKTALKECTCKFIVFLDQDFQSKLNGDNGFFYLSAFSKEGQPLIFEQIDFDLAQLPKSGLVEIAFKMNIPTHLDNSTFPNKKVVTYPKDKIKLHLSFSTKNVGDASFHQDLEDGTFINTTIPIKEADSNA